MLPMCPDILETLVLKYISVLDLHLNTTKLPLDNGWTNSYQVHVHCMANVFLTESDTGPAVLSLPDKTYHSPLWSHHKSLVVIFCYFMHKILLWDIEACLAGTVLTLLSQTVLPTVLNEVLWLYCVKKRKSFVSTSLVPTVLIIMVHVS